MISLVRGDIFESGAKILVNPVNAVGVMGVGLALEFKRRFPKMHEEYRVACRAGLLAPGKLWSYQESPDLIITCFPTKQHWKDQSRQEDIVMGLYTLRDAIWGRSERVAIPALGCGYGGLEWANVLSAMMFILRHVSADVLIYEPQKRVAIYD